MGGCRLGLVGLGVGVGSWGIGELRVGGRGVGVGRMWRTAGGGLRGLEGIGRLGSEGWGRR